MPHCRDHEIEQLAALHERPVVRAEPSVGTSVPSAGTRKPWYFATPYTVRHEDGSVCPEGQRENYGRACVWAAALIEAGYCIFCPIAHSHPIDEVGDIPGKDWYAQDNDIIAATDYEGIILGPCWENSSGCRDERAQFANRDLRIMTYEEALANA